MDNHEIFVTQSSIPPMSEYIHEISSIWDTHCLTNMGPKHQALEKKLKDLLHVNAVSLFTNGHSALEFVLEALELKGEVITTPFTFASTTHAIVRKGLKPVFADIKSDDFTIDPNTIEPLITENTSAILPVHVYGNICDVERIQAIADKYNLKVIYDAAHAFYEKANGISVAQYGDASMFSFHATKVFHTIEGGAICTNNLELADKLNHLKNFGITSPESVDYIGGNAKLNEFAAAMGLCNLRHLDDEIAKRELCAKRYWNMLEDVPGVKLCIPPSKVVSNYAYMPVQFTKDFPLSRDAIFDKLAAKGIHSRKYFYPLTTDFLCYRDAYSSESTPIAKEISSQILTLPLYAELSLSDIDRICDIISNC